MAEVRVVRCVPTGPDVDRLFESFGVPVVGDLVAYELIEDALGEKRGSARWKSVVGRWRRRLEADYSIVLEAEVNQGFRVLTASRILDQASRRFAQGMRQIGRSVEVAQRADVRELSAEERRRRQHLIETGAKLRLAAESAAPELDWSLPTVKRMGGG